MKHYITINENAFNEPVNDYLIEKEEPVQYVIDDLTHGGRILYKHDRNERGAFIEVIGRTLLGWGYPNKMRNEQKDTLYIYGFRPKQLTATHQKKHSGQRGSLKATFLLLPSNQAPALDKLQKDILQMSQTKPEQSSEGFEKQDKTKFSFDAFPIRDFLIAMPSGGAHFPDALLGAILRGGERMFRSWRPTGFEGQMWTLTPFREVWSRFDVRKYAPHTGNRIRHILEGRTEINSISPAEAEKIMGVFGLETMSSFLEKSEDPQATLRFFERIGELPLYEGIRRKVWTHLGERVSAELLIDELRELVQTSFHGERELWLFWRKAVKDVCMAVGEQSGHIPLQEFGHFLNGSIEEIRLKKLRSEFNKLLSPNIEVKAIDQRQPKPEVGPEVEAKHPTLDVLPFVLEEESFIGPLEQWVLSRSGSSSKGVFFEIAAGREQFVKVLKLTSEVRDATSLLHYLSSLDEIKESIEQWKRKLPESGALASYAQEAKNHRELFDVLKKFTPREQELIIARIPSAQALEKGLDFTERNKQLFELVPDWLWEQLGYQSSSTPGLSWLLISLEEDKEEALRKMLVHINEAIQHTATKARAALESELKLFCPDDDELDEGGPLLTITAALGRFVERKKLESPEREEHWSWLRSAQKDGVSFDGIEVLLKDVEDLKGRVSDEVYRHLLGQMEKKEREATLITYRLTANEIEKTSLGQFGMNMLPTLPLQAFLFRVDNKLSATKEPNQGAEYSITELELGHEHVSLDGAYTRTAPFVAVPALDGGTFLAKIPIALRCRHRSSMRMELCLEAISTEGDWPPPGLSFSPTVLEVQNSDWVQYEYRGFSYMYSFCLEIPFSTAQHKTPMFMLFGVEPESQTRMTPERRLEWSSIQETYSEAEFTWKQSVEHDICEKDPIGIQVHRKRIKDNLLANNSVVVQAPRRFGKSTLLRYIRAWAEDEQFVVYLADCMDFLGESEFDYKEMWGTFNAALKSQVSCGLLDDINGPVPGKDDFLAVCQAAKSRGKRGILFIFDEAQLYFTGAQSSKFSSLKGRMEEWRLADVPVLFVFGGLKGMLREQANLRAALESIWLDKFDQQNIYSLINRHTENQVSTTRQARILLSKYANNSYILKALIQLAVERINRDKRCWINHQDIEEVFERLIDSLQKGDARELAKVGTYLRDPLNSSMNVNMWLPIREFPVALALAQVLHMYIAVEPPADEKLLGELKDKLNSWVKQHSYNTGQGTVYEISLIKRHLATLESLQIIDSERRFTSELLRNWLLGYADGAYPSGQEERKLLFQGAHRMIKKPLLSGFLHEGGQATVVQFLDENEQLFAYRETKGTHDFSSEATSGILSNLRTYERLMRSSTLQSGEGAHYIYQLKEFGFVEGDPNKLAQIYRWIDGTDLESYQNAMSDKEVIQIGLKLAKALKVIHQAKIIHRDIRPKNIILASDDYRPVLIDFGFSRIAGEDGRTRAGVDDFTAPESWCEQPVWEFAADVYSLGKTLLYLCKNKKESPLSALLYDCCNEEPQARPGSVGFELINEFEKLSRTNEIEEEAGLYMEALIDQVKTDSERDSLLSVLDEHKVLIDAYHLGFMREAVERHCLSVQILECALSYAEQLPSGEDLDGLARMAYWVSSHSQDKNAIDAIKQLQKLFAYSKRSKKSFQKERQRQRQRLNNHSHRKKHQEALQFISKLAEKHFDIGGLSSIVSHFLVPSSSH